MNTPKPIQIFKAGKHVASSGQTLSFSDADLAATAAAYDPAKHEAPLVVGHPKTDDPAYGWVGKLAFADGALDVAPVQVNADFAEMVKSGAFKKISASFYAPDSPVNPVPGVYYLRHVGFLGAQPPAVKGMRSPQFNDAEAGVIEFADWSDMQNASLWRGMREWIIAKFGLDEADKVVPSYSVQTLEEDARKEDADETAVSSLQCSENQPKGDEMSAEEKARLTALEAENVQLKKAAADFAEAQAKSALALRQVGDAAFADELITAGTLLPVFKDLIVASLGRMSPAGDAVMFGEGDAKKPLDQAFREMLKGLPKAVSFGEAAGGKGAPASVDFAAASGCLVDAESLEGYAQILAYQEKHECSFEVAMLKFNKQQGA